MSVPDETEDVNLNVFNMITKVNETKTLLKHISCDFKCKIESKNVLQIKNGIKISFDVSVKIQLNIAYVNKKKKKNIWSPNTYTFEIKKYIKAILI